MQISPKAILPFIPVAVSVVMCADSLKKYLNIRSVFNEVTQDFQSAPCAQSLPVYSGKNYETLKPTYMPGFLHITIGLIGAIALGTFAPATLSSPKEALKIFSIVLAFHTFVTYRSKSLRQSIKLLARAFWNNSSRRAQNKTFAFKTTSETDTKKQVILFHWFKNCLLHKAKGGDLHNYLTNIEKCPVHIKKTEAWGYNYPTFTLHLNETV